MKEMEKSVGESRFIWNLPVSVYTDTLEHVQSAYAHLSLVECIHGVWIPARIISSFCLTVTVIIIISFYSVISCLEWTAVRALLVSGGRGFPDGGAKPKATQKKASRR